MVCCFGLILDWMIVYGWLVVCVWVCIWRFCDLMFVSLDGFVMVVLVVIGLVQAVVLL